MSVEDEIEVDEKDESGFGQELLRTNSLYSWLHFVERFIESRTQRKNEQLFCLHLSRCTTYILEYSSC